jgi:hypothetical protein
MEKELNSRLTTVEVQLSDFSKLANTLMHYLIALLGFAVLQTGTLIWFLAVTQTQQNSLMQTVSDHELRLRVTEVALRR